ncbi:MAG: glycosyltransferase family 2 protein [Methylococcales bacterium]|nr:glycosyltransferase family 2 protein [Methylococcales bacterium]
MSLSVFIPTYNCGQYIRETIESVLLQSIPLLKIIVVDNYSTDNTEEIVSNYTEKGVSYIKHPVNIGGIPNHNFCLDMADTEYLKLLSADDVLLPGILALQLNALKNNPECGIATCNYLITDSTLHVTAHSKILQGKVKGAHVIKTCATKVKNLIGGPSMAMLRRDAIGERRFNSNFKWTSDLLFFCDILQHSTLINVGVNGVLYRRHNQTDSDLMCIKSIRLHDEMYFVNNFSKRKVEPYLRLLKRYGFDYISKITEP